MEPPDGIGSESIYRCALSGGFHDPVPHRVPLALTLAASTASAQTIGTFRWRTAPYCNVMTVTVTQVGSFYRLEGLTNSVAATRDSRSGASAWCSPTARSPSASPR